MRYAYVAGRDVLHGIDLDLRAGRAVAVVGPSGAGKSTLGRLLAGIHPPRTGTVEVGGVRSSICRSTRSAGRSRSSRRSSTSSSARWPTTCGSRGRAPSDAELRGALAAVDALDWAEALPDGLETVVGAGGAAAHARRRPSSSRSRGSCSPTRTRSSSTRRPRCSTRAPPATSSARSPPCSTGRTVVAIAHRLHTAHDADRVAVVEDGLLQRARHARRAARERRRLRGALGVLAVVSTA